MQVFELPDFSNSGSALLLMSGSLRTSLNLSAEEGHRAKLGGQFQRHALEVRDRPREHVDERLAVLFVIGPQLDMPLLPQIPPLPPTTLVQPHSSFFQGSMDDCRLAPGHSYEYSYSSAVEFALPGVVMRLRCERSHLRVAGCGGRVK